MFVALAAEYVGYPRIAAAQQPEGTRKSIR
jgi:hypothetical protein